MPTPALDPKVVIEVDGYLEPNVPSIIARHDLFRKWKDDIEKHEGGYDSFSKGYEKFGFNIDSNGQVTYREWAPNARDAYLIGDFSQCPLAFLSILSGGSNVFLQMTGTATHTQ